MGCVVATEIVVFIVPKVSCDQGVVGVKEPSMDIKIKPISVWPTCYSGASFSPPF